PEKQEKVQISWIAVHRNIGTFHSVEDVSYDEVIRQELGGPAVDDFIKTLENKSLKPEEYYFMPVHIWQWNHSIVPMFAGEIAENSIVPLGEGADVYLPQQSIRTFVNMSDKE